MTQLLKLLRHSVAMSPPAQSKGTKARQTNHSTLHLLLSATSRIEARLHTATAPPFWSHDFSDVRPKGSLDARGKVWVRRGGGGERCNGRTSSDHLTRRYQVRHLKARLAVMAAEQPVTPSLNSGGQTTWGNLDTTWGNLDTNWGNPLGLQPKTEKTRTDRQRNPLAAKHNSTQQNTTADN